MDLAGHKILITGANRGLGAAFVEAALARRARERAITYTPERMADGYMAAYGALSSKTRDLQEDARLICAS